MPAIIKLRDPLHRFTFLLILTISVLFGRFTIAQNLYVAASSNIYQYTPNGTQSIFASGLDEPFGLAFNGSGLFVSDLISGNIYEYTANGTRSTFASGLSYPDGLAFNSAGELFVDNFLGNIFKFAPNGNSSIFVNGLNEPIGLAFNTGNLFVTDYGSGNIYEFTSNGIESVFASGLNGPGGLVFNSTGDLFEANHGSGNIYEFMPNGNSSIFVSGLNNPTGLAFSNSGNLFEVDQGSGNIYEFTPNGSRSTFATGLNTAWGLAFAPISSWTSTISGNWSNSGNWTWSVPNGISVGAVLNAPTTTLVTVTLDMPVTLGSLQLGNSGSAANTGYTLSGSNTLTFNNLGNGATITATNGTHNITVPVILADNLTVAGSNNSILIFGTASSIIDNGAGHSLTMDGIGGTLILSGSDTYTGGTFIEAGTLEITTAIALPTGNLIIGADGTFIFDPTANEVSPIPSVCSVSEPSSPILMMIGLGLLGLFIGAVNYPRYKGGGLGFV